MLGDDEKESAALELKSKAILKLLQGCNSLSRLRKIHCHVITTGLLRHSPAVSSKLLSFSAVSVSGSLLYAQLLFRHHVPSPTTHDWNSLIRGFSRSSSPLTSASYYNRMVSEAAELSLPDSYTFSFLLRACERARSAEKCREVHGSLVRRGFERDVLVFTNLVRCYAGNGAVDLALKVFDEMPVRDLVAWNAMISCCAQKGLYGEALRVYDRMREADVGPDAFTLVALLSCCADVGALSFGVEVHRVASDMGFLRSVFVGNALIDMYGKCGSLDSALLVFSSMPKRDVFTWNSMIVGYGVHGRGDEAIEFFEKMVVMDRIQPNSITFLGLLCGCSHQGLVDKGIEYFDLMSSKYNIKPGIKHYGCLVDMVGRAGKLKKALEIIETCPSQQDPVLWRTLLSSCKIHRNVKIGEIAMRNLVRLGATNAGDCVLLASVYREINDANGVARMRKMIKRRGIKTIPGWSWIEVENKVRKFVVDDDKSHPRTNDVFNNNRLREVIHELSVVGCEEDLRDKACSYHIFESC